MPRSDVAASAVAEDAGPTGPVEARIFEDLLRRRQAEFENFRRRVDRERHGVRRVCGDGERSRAASDRR